MRARAGAVVAALLLAAGCGTATGSHGTPSPGTPPPSTSKCAPAALVEADDGHTVCLAVGRTVRVDLPDPAWAPVTSSGPGLVKVSDDTFRASAPGTVRLTTSRRLCPSPSTPGMVSCHGIRAWSVTVDVEKSP